MRIFIRVALLGGLVACLAPEAGAAQTAGMPTPNSERPSRRGRGPIERTELEGRTDANLLAAIQGLRPGWLRGGGSGVRVYVDAVSVGNGSELEGMSVEMVERVVLYSPTAAIARFGQGHEGGVVVVFMRK
jgi:hypothetical protein